MGKILFQLVILAIGISVIVYFIGWRWFFQIGKGVNKEMEKIKKEAKRGEKE